MRDRKSDPPKQAIWFLQNACPGDNEALAGDLVERFREGQTRGWFWKQVLIVFAVGVLNEIWRHWPHFCYAIAGTALHVFLWNAVQPLPRVLHWWVLAWPWSQVVLELSGTALSALAALPALAAGLAVRGEFRLGGLFRTGVGNLALITLHKYLLDFFGPWLSRPIPGNPYAKGLIIPGILQVLLFLSTFLVAAWLGCRSPQRLDDFEQRAKP
jgi:hypothetical protein